MSGVFRNLNSTDTTPNKRLSFGTFSTNSSNMTMENMYGVGYQSPYSSMRDHNVTSPPVQGRCVREFEEQLTSLRKENFNLKLRLYFMEESLPGFKNGAHNQSDNKECSLKPLIDAKVEMEILRREIQEKQDLLKEAAQAMTQMEKIQEETEVRSQAAIDELQQKIHFLEVAQHEMEKTNLTAIIPENEAAITEASLQKDKKIQQLEEAIKHSQNKLADFQQQITELDKILMQRDETIKEYEDKVKELAVQNSELLETAEKKESQANRTEYEQLRLELQNMKSQLADKICMLQMLEEKLQQRDQVHEKACRTIHGLMLTNKNQNIELKKLKSNNATDGTNESNRNEERVNTEYVTVGGIEVADLRSVSDSEPSNDLSKKVAEQELIIESLKMEVKKKTANLQNLVNKELWEKNREIERLTKLINKDSVVVVAATSNQILSTTAPSSTSAYNDQQQQSLSDLENTNALENNKYLRRKVDALVQRLNFDQKNEKLVNQLNIELKQAKVDLECANKWRSECADVCAVLTNRLEELAGFLNTLLKHKDVAGVLAADRRRAMRKAVDRSLDLSKTLNRTLSISGNLPMDDTTIAELSNLSKILCDADDDENRTFNSHEDQYMQQCIETLTAENKALKKELDKRRLTDARKERRSLPLPAQENQSESEAWSEPDRKVSMARMGLDEHSTSLSKGLQQIGSDSDSDSHSLNCGLKSQEHKAIYQERAAQLEQLVAQRDMRILDIQCQLVDADNRLKQENLRVLNMEHDVNELRQRNVDLTAAVESEPRKSLLLRQIDEQTNSLDTLRDERDNLVMNIELAEIQLNTLRTDLNELKEKHESDLNAAKEHAKMELIKLKQNMENLMQQALDEQRQQHTEALASDWIALTNYEELKQQLVELQQRYAESMRNIEYHQENEQELKQSLVDSELAARALKKQLDESTLQASKAILERTAAFNDRLQSEQRVQELSLQMATLKKSYVKLSQELHRLGKGTSSSSQSGYTSEDIPFEHGATAETNAACAVRRQRNSSPDLGIESDAGRVSRAEISNVQHAMLKTLELHSANGNGGGCNLTIIDETKACTENVNGNSTVAVNKDVAPRAPIKHDCAKIEMEHAELIRKLIRTERALENTYEKLRTSNKWKAQVQKEIKNQIVKTNNVLRNVRSNMENEL